MTTRQDVINEARTWMGTRFHHQGRLKGVGVDCIGILSGTLQVLNLLKYDNINYTKDPDSDKLVSICDKYLIKIPIEEAKPGDVLLMSWRRGPQHMALLTDQGILHAHIGVKKVVEHVYDDEWKARTVAAYNIPGLED